VRLCTTGGRSCQDTHVRIVNVVEMWISPVDESLHSGDLGDEEEEEKEQRVHDDLRATDTTEGKES